MVYIEQFAELSAEETKQLRKSKHIKGRKSLKEKFGITLAKNSGWSQPTDGSNLGYHSFSQGSDHFSFYTDELPGCCGAILAHSFAFSDNAKKALFQIKFITELLHNIMNRFKRPLTMGTITSANWQYSWAFNHCGWVVAKGVPSQKHYSTNGINHNNILNVIYPIYLRVKNVEVIEPIKELNDDEILRNKLNPDMVDHEDWGDDEWEDE
jgi:hypothetical protein